MNTRIKAHLEKHRTNYIILGTSVVVAGITMAIMKDPKRVLLSETQTTLLSEVVAPDQAHARPFIFSDHSIMNMGTVTNNIHYGKKGHPGFLTIWVETGKIYKSQKAAARAIGVSDSLMSTHLNGKLSDLDGQHFERLHISD